jgi:hypothetical protein
MSVIHRFFYCRHGRHEWIYIGSCVRQLNVDDEVMEWSEYKCPHCNEVKRGDKHPYYYKSGRK